MSYNVDIKEEFGYFKGKNIPVSRQFQVEREKTIQWTSGIKIFPKIKADSPNLTSKTYRVLACNLNFI